MLSSAAHVTAPPGGVDYSTLKKGDKLLGEWTEYGESKWGDLALAKYVDKHYGPRSGNPDGEVVSIAIHPGLVRTNLYAHLSIAEAIAAKFPFLLNLMNVAPITGALNQIWAGQLPVEEAKEISGKYVVPYQVIATHRPDLNDPAKWEQLWNWCNEQAKRAE
jgi:NAD(P)-dependent dehydrogenase (short-subunit alcohol dehydrogenase family)